MKTEQEYLQSLSEIRQMMERSSRFLSLTGWSGIMAGIYALAGAYIAYRLFFPNQEDLLYGNSSGEVPWADVYKLILLALMVMLLAIGTAVFLSYKKAHRSNEVIWNATTRRLLMNMAIPLFTGGILILVLISKGLIGLMAPLSLIFYGLSLIIASKYTFDELRYLGILEILLGLISAYFVGFALLSWALGFGILHIVYGIYLHRKYEK